MDHKHDVLIIGSGAAGLTLALNLPKNLKIALLCKGPLYEGSTHKAQGGIAAVLDDADTIEGHIKDTLIAGAGLCNEDAVRFTVENGKKSIQWLIDQGVEFTKESNKPGLGAYHLTREGGHSHRRIIHAADATGKSVEETLNDIARKADNIDIFEYHIAVDLIKQDKRIVGAYVYNDSDDRVDVFAAKATALATGGAGRVYLYSSNPIVSSGDGIAIGYRAGCRVANLEFNQFHPTCLYHPKAGSFLISEALRGEGAILRLPDGTRFMEKFDKRLELAPRDIVARAIDYEMKRLALDCVYLDITHKPAKFIISHFPNIYEKCKELGFDLTKEPIPVVPASHYTCGGIMIDKHGRTDLAGLYAAGEVTFTGLHGANRMASNSLLECLVYGASAAKDITKYLESAPIIKPINPWDESQVADSDEEIMIKNNWEEIRHCMWNYVGIVRSNKRLERAKRRIEMLKYEIADYYGHFRVTKDLLELRNLVQVAELMIKSALSRHESRGLHYTLDYKDKSDKLENTVLGIS